MIFFIVPLLSIGIFIIFSWSLELGVQQSLFAILGIFLFIFFSKFDYRALKGLTTALYILAIILLVIVLILGVETRGSVRWISLGIFNIQPSELIKPVLILILARFWSANLPTWGNVLKSIGLVILPILLIFKQPDLGTSITLLAIWFGTLLATEVHLKKIISIFILLLLILPLIWSSLQDYQKVRVINFLSPGNEPLGVGYNIIQSKIAVGSGQFWGKGLGQGTQSRLKFLPEYRTDFIFASIAEELGFLGSALILLIYFFLIFYILNISRDVSDLFGLIFVFGTISMLLFQTIVNIGMNMGIFPIAGIPLPLLSYGGSSLVATLTSLGIISSIVNFNKKIDTESSLS